MFETEANTAIKGFKHEKLYRNERDVYERIDEYDMYEVQGCRIPHVHGTDDDLWCIEMEIVSPHYTLDFAGAYLNFLPEYPEEVLVAWTAEKLEQYGEDWPWVQQLLRELARVDV